MKIISQKSIRDLGISPKVCCDWIRESFACKQNAQLPAKISVHPADCDFFTSMPCLIPEDEKTFQPGVTVIPVHMRGLQNCDTAFDRVFGDGTNHVKGFKYFSEYHDYNEISEVLAGRDPGRKSQVQRIIDYNYGLALHDVVYAAKIYKLMKDVECPEFEIVKETDKFLV